MVCNGPLRSTSSPAPPAAHGTKTAQINVGHIIDLFCRVSRHAQKRQRRKHEQRCDDILLHNVFPLFSRIEQPSRHRPRIKFPKMPCQFGCRERVRFGISRSREFLAQLRIMRQIGLTRRMSLLRIILTVDCCSWRHRCRSKQPAARCPGDGKEG